MNANSYLQPATREQCFRDLPQFAVPCRGLLEFQLERLKNQLLAPMLHGMPDSSLAKELKCAANEAAALAWFTGYPLLLFPSLLEEKASMARKRWERQQEIWALAA